jgi:lysophospholipase L1-like esterase
VLKGWRGWAATPLAVGGTAALVLASTAGATPALGALASKTAPLSPAQYALAATGSNTPVVAAGTKGPIRALMLGDSEASFLGFGLGPPSTAYNVNYAGDGTFGCGFQYGATTLNYVNDPGTMGTRSGNIEVPCRDQLTRWKADLETFHPDVVLVANGEYEVRNRLLDGTWTHIGEPGFDAAELHAIRNAVQVLRSTGAVVVLLTAPYYHQPEEMSGASWPEDDPQRVSAYNAILRQVAAESKSGVVVEDLNAHLDPHGQYTQYIDHINVRFADGIHVTAAGASLVAPWMLSQVEALGTANRAASMGASPAPAGAATASSP